MKLLKITLKSSISSKKGKLWARIRYTFLFQTFHEKCAGHKDITRIVPLLGYEWVNNIFNMSAWSPDLKGHYGHDVVLFTKLVYHEVFTRPCSEVYLFLPR